MKVKARLIIAAVIAVVIAAIGIWLLFVPKAFKYGLILLGVVFLAVLIWKAFIQSGQQELRVSQERTTELEKQVGELRERLEEISTAPSTSLP